MKLLRRKFLHLTAGAVALPAVSRGATAQTYPSRPITMIVPFPAGGVGDAVARIIAEPMRRSLGQPIIIENVGGADGSIGSGRVARARPDGYTIQYGATTTHVLNGAFYSLPYDLLNAFAPIAPISIGCPMIVGRKTLRATDLRELITWLKANPNRASMGVGFTGARLLATYLQQQTGTQFTLVPYRGRAPAMQDLVAGQIDLSIDFPVTSLPLMRAGSIKGYVRASDKRLAQNAISALLPHGRVRVEDIARGLGMSKRTLARKLSDEGLDFTKILRQLRHDLAVRYIDDSKLHVSKVAWLLGFNEVSAFTHAFKRWTGKTPSQMRTVGGGY
jgi:tripartite-type tricarboxylate transporter receptor subunit TctC